MGSITRPPKPVLGYWNLRARGEFIKAFLAYVGADYELKLYDQECPAEWLEKDQYQLGLSFPNLPYWIDDGIHLTQSNAIIRHLARKYDLCGSDENTTASADMLAEYFEDVRKSHIFLLYRVDKQNYGEKRIEFEKTWIEEKLPQIAKFLGNKKFLLGDKICYVDFILYELLFDLDLFTPSKLARHLNLVSYVQSMKNLPELSAFRAKQACDGLPVYALSAHWQGWPRDFIPDCTLKSPED